MNFKVPKSRTIFDQTARASVSRCRSIVLTQPATLAHFIDPLSFAVAVHNELNKILAQLSVGQRHKAPF